LGNADKSTNIVWTFPSLTQRTLGPIYMTPTVAFNKVYFGTLSLNDSPGRFFALDAVGNTGNQTTTAVWELNQTNPAGVINDGFVTSPAVVPYSTLNYGSLSPNSGIVYAVNQNLFTY